MDGVLVLDKPPGPTSHDVVAFARRVLREKRIGHTGTLDPLATGVLPLVIGKATRLASLISATEKEYEATVRLGATSDTYDGAGKITATRSSPIDIDASRVARVLDTFLGTFEQMPPPYSAKKVAGVPAYELARKQQPTTLKAVPVTVHELELLGVGNGSVRLRVRTSPGFYVRSLAHELGERLGCGAFLERLRRTRSGGFGLDQAVTLESLDRDPELGRQSIVPLEDLVPDLPAVRVTGQGAERLAHGNFLSLQHFTEKVGVPFSGPVRVFDGAGRLLAIAADQGDGVLRPSVVLV